jgi:acyl dehydratase
MAVRADCVGQDLDESSVEITPRMVLAYAAGLGETDDRYLDDLRPGGIVAPPAYCVVLEWPIVSGARYRQVTGTSAEEAYGAIHVLQDSRFHRPVRPGDRLTTSGRIVQARQTSAGTLVVTKLETRHMVTADPVATSWFGVLFLRIGLDGPSGTLEEPPALRTARGLGPNAPTRIAVPIARTLPHVYTECAGIWNPIHTERRVALATKLPDIILHGTATWALTAQHLVHAAGGGNPARLARVAGRFHGMVIPGTTIGIEYVADPARHALDFVVRNAAGEFAITNGIAEFVADSERTNGAAPR